MARKHYTDEFRRQAVELYESTPGATLRGIATDLGIARGTLADWVAVLGIGTTSTSTGSRPPPAAGAPESSAARLARLEAQVRQLQADKTKLTTEREILRSAAKYFAGETNW